MATDKFLSIDTDGNMVEESALQTSSGSGDSGKVIQTNDSGVVDETMLPTYEGIDLTASEALDAGDLINVWDDAGTAKMRKADASGGKPAHGYVLNSVSSTSTGTAYGEGKLTGLSGLTPGASQFLSDSTAGTVTESPVTTSGNLLQKVGEAVSTTTVAFERREAITRA